MKPVTVIICIYNEASFIEKCLSNLQGIRDSVIPDLKVIVKDNGSTDDSATIIKEKFPWVHLIVGQNDGLSKGYNQAYKEANTEYLLFLGADAFPEKDTVPGLIQYFDSHADVGAATVKLLLADESLDMDAHRAFPTPWISASRILGLNKFFPKSPILNGYFLPDRDMTQPHEIDLCISHFMFTRKSLLDKLGGFDEDFFLYGEDVDICYRIKQSGAKIMYLPMWSAHHMKGGSVGVRNTTRHLVKKPLTHRLKMQKLSTRAMELFLRKHYMNKYPKPFVYFMIYSSRVVGFLRVLAESLR